MKEEIDWSSETEESSDDNSEMVNEVSPTIAYAITSNPPNNYLRDKNNCYRLLQLFPDISPVSLEIFYFRCNKDVLRTIDNILYTRRYMFFLAELNNTKTRNDIDSIHNTTVSDTDETNSTQDSTNQYIPNGTEHGINMQIQEQFHAKPSNIDATRFSTTDTFSYSTFLDSSSTSSNENPNSDKSDSLPDEIGEYQQFFADINETLQICEYNNF